MTPLFLKKKKQKDCYRLQLGAIEEIITSRAAAQK
jgi:hypothetical protein